MLVPHAHAHAMAAGPQPWTPGQALMLSRKSVRGDGEVNRRDRESRAEWWFVLIAGSLFLLGLIVAFLP